MKRLRAKLENLYYTARYPFIKNTDNTRDLKDIIFKESFNKSFWNRWSNGWYVNGGGNDDRKMYNFEKRNVDPTGKSLYLYSKGIREKSGCMIYSKRLYKYGIFRFKLGLGCFEGEEFAFWLKSYTKDVYEIDNLEIFMDGNPKQELLFTTHEGTNYFSDHKYFPNSVRDTVLLNNPLTFDLEWRPNKLTWRVNGNIVKVHYDNIPNEEMGIIINYGKISGKTWNSAAKITEIIVAENYE